MFKTLSVLSLCVFSWVGIRAQSSGTLWSGQILDQETQAPVSFVHIVGTDQPAISDSQGIFSVRVQSGDTLQFSHINYERYAILVWVSAPRPSKIYMTKKENVLQEVIIYNHLPEEELKKEIVKREAIYSDEEVNAKHNVEYSTLLFKRGFIPEMNSLDNFKNYIKDPQGVTFFSTNPSRGLIRTIKRLRKQNDSFDLNQLNRVKNDTLRVHQFFIKEE